MILMVDDSEGNLLAMESSLAGLGAKIVKAPSGQEALSCVLRDDFAVILLDVQMPGMDGFEAARLMRGNKRTAAIPMIFVTGNLDEQAMFRGYESGAVDYLLKPYQPDILRSKVKVFVDLFRQSQELAVLQELRVTQKVLEERNRELLDFISAAHHDLREPIRQLAIYCELFSAETDCGRKDTVQVIRDTGKALLAQNDRLQAYARILTEQRRFKPIQLGSLVEDLVEHLRTEIETCEGGVEIGCLPEVVGDPEQMRLLFQILIENALQYARPGVPPRVQIKAEQDNGWSAISVHDNGRGFDLTHLTSILRPFNRLVTKSDVQGTGLGLSLAKRIVEFHGGELNASSEANQGSQFRIRLRPVDNNMSPFADGPQSLESAPLPWPAARGLPPETTGSSNGGMGGWRPMQSASLRAPRGACYA
jgi:signal transduction histidine kinase